VITAISSERIIEELYLNTPGIYNSPCLQDISERTLDSACSAVRMI
jgi:hypothetical protein